MQGKWWIVFLVVFFALLGITFYTEEPIINFIIDRLDHAGPVELIRSVILFSVFAILEGVRDGYFWHYAFRDIGIDRNKMVHRWFWLTRFIVACCISTDPYFLAFAALSFSFFHNGFYFITRNHISIPTIYDKGFMDDSTTDQSFWGFLFTWPFRVSFFALGCMLITTHLIRQYYGS